MMGNIRVTFSDDNSDGIPETKSINDYYSFGMEWNNRWELRDTISPVCGGDGMEKSRLWTS